jgi:hypothetical protein
VWTANADASCESSNADAVQEVGSEVPPNSRVACSGRSARNRPSASTSASSGAVARLTLADPATGERVDLESFGPTNAAAFAQLLTARPLAAH